MRLRRAPLRPGVMLSPGPSSLGQALGAVAVVLADGAVGDLADGSAAVWRPWLGAAVALVGVHAIWEIASTRRIVAGPAGVHWSGGLSPSAGSVPWQSVCRIDARHARFSSEWSIEVLEGPGEAPRLLTLRGPGRWHDLTVRTPERLAAWWRQAGEAVQVFDFPWGWRLEADREPPTPRLRRRQG